MGDGNNGGRCFIFPYLLSLQQHPSYCQEFFHRFPQFCSPTKDSATGLQQPVLPKNASGQKKSKKIILSKKVIEPPRREGREGCFFSFSDQDE